MKKGFKYLLLILVVMLLFGCKKPNNNNNDNNTIKEQTFYKLDLTKNFDDEESYTATINGVKIEVDLNDGLRELFINNGQVYEPVLYNMLEPVIYFFDGNVVYSTTSGYTHNIFIYNEKDQSLINYTSSDPYNLIINSFEATEEGITIEASNIDRSGIIFNEEDEINNCEMFNKHKEAIMKGKFMLKYSKSNRSFGNMETLETTKLKDLNEAKSLCN